MVTETKELLPGRGTEGRSQVLAGPWPGSGAGSGQLRGQVAESGEARAEDPSRQQVAGCRHRMGYVE
ncbi:hypothetical protein BX266_6700 [Streptomyces sp. TLI_171]|nr:hypothetical protein BX266_6700 [Streptomyces sp. TLI_171]